MKKSLALFAALTVLLSAIPQMRSQDVSVNFFYDNLEGGNWYEVGDYGYCWQPDVALNDSTWRPYADGYWAYTDDGWTWVSYEDFGWATYHYGRWVKLAEYGWVWKPGYEWAPAWVSWRTGGNYIGWAPLPPETEYVYESRPLTGHLDIEFDIGPGYYNFCDVRYIGEPVLRSRLVPYQQNVTYITQTVNVTNIIYKNKTVYNYGPDVNVVNQYSSRPIQRLKLERQTNADFSSTAVKSGGLTKVQGNALIVAAPTRLNKPANEIAPPRVKTKVAQPKVEKGWAEVGDANAQTQFKEKIKTQDLNKIPPPTLGAAGKVSGAPNASPGMSASGAGAESPLEKVKGKGKNKNKMGEQMQPASPGMSASPGTSPVFPEGGKKKWKHPENQTGAMTSPATGTVPETSANPAAPEGGKKKNKRFEQNQPGAMTAPSTGTGAEMSPGGMPEAGKLGKGKNRRNEQFGGTPAPTGQMPEGTTAPEMKHKEKGKNFGSPAGGTIPQSVSDQPGGADDAQRRKFEQLERAQRREPGPPANSRSGAPGAPSATDTFAPEPKHKERGQNFGAPAGGTTPQSVTDQPAQDLGQKQRIPERRPPGPPPNSQSGAAAAPAVNQKPSVGNQPAGERKHEGKQKSGESPAPSPQ